MSTASLGSRVLESARNPWVAMLYAFGGGILWALDMSVSQVLAGATVLWVTSAAVGALTRSRARQVASPCCGVRQRELVEQFDDHVRALRTLDGYGLPEVVRTKAAEALVAADSVRPTVWQLAVATDVVDDAIATAGALRAQGPLALSSIGTTVGRLRTRRDGLLERLATAVDEIATVYAGLLELSATASTIGLGVQDREISAVNDSITLLHMTFAELEVQAADLVRDTSP